MADQKELAGPSVLALNLRDIVVLLGDELHKLPMKALSFADNVEWT